MVRVSRRGRIRRRNPDNRELRELAGVTVLVGAINANWFSIFSPSLYEVRSDLQTDPVRTRGLLRSAYVPATMWGLGFAGAASIAQRSILPLFVGAATTMGMIWAYERALPADVRLNPFGALLAGFQTPEGVTQAMPTNGRVHILPYPYPEAA